MLPIRVLRMRKPVIANLITNGTFATDTDWAKGIEWTISGGTANFSLSLGTQTLSQALAAALSPSTNYRLTYTITSSPSSIGVTPNMSGGSGTITGARQTAVGTYSFDFTTGASAQTTVNFVADAVFGSPLSIDNIVLAPN